MDAIAKTAPRPVRTSRRAGSRKGAELLEFTFCFLPLTAMLILLVDASWGIYVKSTLAYAVHEGVRQGITIDSTQAAGTTLTAMVQNIVQTNALGLLAGATNLSKIHVDYYRVSSTDSTKLTTVTQAGGGIMAGDIIQVSIQSYSLPALTPRIYNWKSAPDNSPTSISAVAADRIEPFSSLPSI
jgi:Flp pilus assembly protein TadG